MSEMLSDDEYRVAWELRKIPQRNNHFLTLHGDNIAVGAALVGRGLAAESTGLSKGDRTFRLNKPGREALYAEFEFRGGPPTEGDDA